MKYVIYTDTICGGYTADKDKNGDIVTYTKEEAEKELQDLFETFQETDPNMEREDFDYHMMPFNEYQEGYKTIYNGKESTSM